MSWRRPRKLSNKQLPVRFSSASDAVRQASKGIPTSALLVPSHDRPAFLAKSLTMHAPGSSQEEAAVRDVDATLSSLPMRLPGVALRSVLGRLLAVAKRLVGLAPRIGSSGAAGLRVHPSPKLLLAMGARRALVAFRGLGFLLFENGDRCGPLLEEVVALLVAVLSGDVVPQVAYDMANHALAAASKARLQGRQLPGPSLLPSLAAALWTFDEWLEVRQAALVCAGNLLQRGGVHLKPHSEALYAAVWAALRSAFRMEAAVTASVRRLLPAEGPGAPLPADLQDGVARCPSCCTVTRSRLLGSSLRALQLLIPSCSGVYRPHIDELLRILHTASTFKPAHADEARLPPPRRWDTRQGGASIDLGRAVLDEPSEAAEEDAAVVQVLSPQPVAPSLLTALLFDSSARVREAAASALAAVLDKTPFQKWIALPPITDSPGPGSPASQRTAGRTSLRGAGAASPSAASPPARFAGSSPAAAAASPQAGSPGTDGMSAASLARMERVRAARASVGGRGAARGGIGTGPTTASDRTAAMVIQTHKGLARALSDAARPQAPLGLAVAVVKTAATLVGATPYERLASGLVSRLAAPLCDLVCCRRQAVVVAALQCVGALVTAKGCLCEVRSFVFDGPPSSASEAGNKPGQAEPDRRPGLLRTLLDIAEDKTAPSPVRAEVLAALAKMSHHYARALSLAWPRLAPVLRASFSDPQAPIRSSGLRVLEELLRARAAEAAALAGAASSAVAAAARAGSLPEGAPAGAAELPSRAAPGAAAAAAAAVSAAAVSATAPAAAGMGRRGAPATGQVEPLVAEIGCPDRGTQPGLVGGPAAGGCEASSSEAAPDADASGLGWPSPTAGRGDAGKAESDEDALPLGLLVSKHLPRAMRDPAVPVRSVACMCVSYLLPTDWQARAPSDRARLAATALGGGGGVEPSAVDEATRLAVVESVFAACRDESAAVRAAGCRVLGSFSTFALWKRPSFARPAVEHMLTCVTDPVLNVRSRAAWGLGCLCAAPVLVAALPPTLRAAALVHPSPATSAGQAPALASAGTQRPADPKSAPRRGIDAAPPAQGLRDGAAAASAPREVAPIGQSPLRPVSVRSMAQAEAAAGRHAQAASRHVGSAGEALSSGAAPESSLTSLLGPDLLRRLVLALSRLCEDHDRVASSAARTMGLAASALVALERADGADPASASCASVSSQEPRDADLTARGARVLCRLVRDAKGASAKTRWNAAYAIGVLLAAGASWGSASAAPAAPASARGQRARLPTGIPARASAARSPPGVKRQPSLGPVAGLPSAAFVPPSPSSLQAVPDWRTDALAALREVLCSASNFKVRIAAAQALGDAASASAAFAAEACVALAEGLERASTATDFTEYRYKAQLEQQACQALRRALVTVGPAPPPGLAERLEPHGARLRAMLRSEWDEDGTDADSDDGGAAAAPCEPAAAGDEFADSPGAAASLAERACHVLDSLCPKPAA
ncbi:hypothetical protein FNF27_02473 [Cafeteria roenbergensis]|uniref:DUF4042 domain-containing protein n=1 Tax=Cafeteria roenbergensis TaxID=33653 RepID=A0A5A8EDX2_CAFRO|nr:hypothetical protein FNF27_02473 [Cafeteria roenbergensis]